MNKKAISIAEIIIAVAVLAILSSIAYISYNWYTQRSRDSARLSDLANIQKNLELKLTSASRIPLPDKKIDITSNWKIINYQWIASERILNILWIYSWGNDPLDNNYYTYSTNKRLTKYQILWFLEDFAETALNTTIQQTNAIKVDYSKRIPIVKGNELWILIEEITNTPINQLKNNIDINNTNTWFTLLLNNNASWIISWTWKQLEISLDHRINEYWSCDSILKNWMSSWNWIYTLKINWTTKTDVYCDMKENSWWRTSLFSIVPDGKTWKFDSSEWTSPTIKWKYFLNEETTTKAYEHLKTNSIKICRWDLDHCYEMNHNKNIPLMKFYTNNISYTDFSRFIYREEYDSTHSFNNNYPDDIWDDRKDEYLSNLWITNNFNTSLYNKYWAWINIYSRNKLWLQADNNNWWPSVDNVWIWIWMSIRRPSMGGCSTLTRPIPNDVTLSTMITWWSCYYDNPDDQMWYVLGK